MQEKNFENSAKNNIEKEKEMLCYINFHLHANFSNLKMLDAYWTVEQHVEHCHKIWYPGVALTDHGSVSWHLKLIKACKEKWIKPICWCEMYAVEDLEEMKRVRDKIVVKKSEEQETDEYQEYKEDEKSKARKKMHFNVLARNQKWLLRLWELVSISWIEWYYAKPSIDWKELSKDKENLLFWTACESWPLWKVLDHEKFIYTKELEKEKRIKEEKINELEKELISFEWNSTKIEKIKELKEEIQQIKKEIINLEEKRWKEFEVNAKEALKKELNRLKELFWDSLYVEIIPIPDDRARWKYLWSYEVAKELWVLCIWTNDAHYPAKEDSKFQDVLYCNNLRRSKKDITFYQEDRKRYNPWLFYNHSAEEMFERLKETFPEFSSDECKDLVNNTMIIFNKIEEVVEPKVPAVAFEVLTDKAWERPTNLYHEMLNLLQEGWKFRKFDELLTPEKKVIYKARIQRELEVILNKGYIDYFMIMRDIMNWCETDRPFIENFEKWFEINWEYYYPWEAKENVYEKIKGKGLLDPKKPIATWIARGSAWGSLVTYLLRITNIDPMPFDLLFERFIDYTRWNVYYKLNYNNYSKSKFLEEFPEENLEKIKQLEEKYKPILVEKIKNLLKNDPWYNHLQIKREFWLLDHNQEFSREKEYFYTLVDKIEKKEILADDKNENNSILSWLSWVTKEEPKWDYVVNLTDIPDIDSDFEDLRRDEVYYYLIHRYWIHNSCRIATYWVIKDKSWLDMLVRIFAEKDPKDEKWERVHPAVLVDIKDIKQKIEEYKKVVEVKSTQSIKKKHVKWFLEIIENEYKEKYPWIWEFWEAMFDQVIAMWMHAAWMIVHNKPIIQYWATYFAKDKNWEKFPLIAWEKGEAEWMWLMKLDILWLNTCANIRETSELIEKRHWWKHNWQMIPWIYENEKTKKLLKNWDVSWLFQLEWGTMNWLTLHLQPETLEEVIMINAWWRPGPLEYIHSLKYKDKKNWLIEPFYFNNKIYEEITKERYWLLIYQEDIMAISRDMCKYNPYMVWKIRKMVWKATSWGLDELEDDFIWRLIEHSQMSPEDAKNLWNYIKSFWTYCFNKAHAAAYWMFAWIQWYYKSNYPLEFYAWTLKTLPDKSEDKINLLLKDYKKHWFKLLPPDINESKVNFEINKDIDSWEEAIRTWFLYIKWLWTKQADEIQRKQPFLDYKDFIKKIDKRVVNSSVRQIIKDVWMFNNIWGCPLVDEKLVPAIEFLEFLWDIPELISDLIQNYSDEKLNDLYILFGVKENKLPVKIEDDLWEIENVEENEEEEEFWELSIWLYKNIITKIKSKIKVLEKGIVSWKLNKSEIQISQEFITLFEQIRENLDKNNKLVIWKLSSYEKNIKKIEKENLEILKQEFKNLENNPFDFLLDAIPKIEKIKWRKENNEKNITEWIQNDEMNLLKDSYEFIWEEIKDFTKENLEENKDCLLKSLNKEYQLIIDNLLNKNKDKKEQIEKLQKEILELAIKWNDILKENFQECILPILIELKNWISDVIESLNIDQWNHIVVIDSAKAMKYCPILLNVNLSKYSKIIAYLKNNILLRSIDQEQEVTWWTTVWMILEKNILQDPGSPFKKRVHMIIMIWEYQKNLFINNATYERNKEIFDRLQIADPVLVKFTKTIKFPVVNVTSIWKLEEIFDKVVNKKWELNRNDLSVLK